MRESLETRVRAKHEYHTANQTGTDVPKPANHGARVVRAAQSIWMARAVLLLDMRQAVDRWWRSPSMNQWRNLLRDWFNDPLAGTVLLLGGTAFVTLFVAFIDRVFVPLPNPGMVYLPLAAMLAYHWGWRHGAIVGILAIICVYYFFVPPGIGLKPLDPRNTEQLVTLSGVTAFVMALVQLARTRRALAEREAGRFAALNHVGTAVASELNEARLLNLIARTAQELTGAEVAAFTLRPMDEFGRPIGPVDGSRFHLAAVVGVTPQQEEKFRTMPLGGEGLLAPIFRHGVTVRISDVLTHAYQPDQMSTLAARADHAESPREAARRAASAYSEGLASADHLHYLGVPRGHPGVRSFLGAPLTDTAGQVRGGLLLGHSQPSQFTHEDEVLLMGLATQATIALENARLYRSARTQAQELDATFESIADGITLISEDGRVLRENSASRRLRATIDHNDHAHTARTLLSTAAARATGSKDGEGQAITVPDTAGESRTYMVSASPLRGSAVDRTTVPAHPEGSEDDPPPAAVVVWHDITEAQRLIAEQRAHAEANARRALLQTVIDELPSGICLVRGTDARLVLANRAAAEAWGATWAEGQTMSEFLATSGTRVLAADGRPMQTEELATVRSVRSSEAVRHHQEIIRHPDGTTLPVLLNAVALDPHVLGWPAQGEVSDPASDVEPAALIVLQDVTALKEAERLKDEFIGIAAHELRNPMAALKGFAQMLTLQTARGNGAQLDEWQKEAVEAIDQATTRLVELTDDLLDVTRLQGGRLELRLEPTDLSALARRVATRAEVTTDQHHVCIDSVPEHVIANIDRQRIEQVLTNLINNALKYSPHGGDVEVTIREDPKTDNAVVSVRDHGIGIPAQQQARIFGRFVRADNARDQGISGTGLGLYLCRELVERHGGRIWFDSTEGQGSTFHISLPLSAESGAPDETPLLSADVL